MHIKELYESVTNSIIKDLEAGVASWVKPWKTNGGGILPFNAATKRSYNGINIPILWHASSVHGWPTMGFMTYKQAKDIGAQVKGGEKGTAVIFRKPVVNNDNPEDGSQGGTLKGYANEAHTPLKNPRSSTSQILGPEGNRHVPVVQEPAQSGDRGLRGSSHTRTSAQPKVSSQAGAAVVDGSVPQEEAPSHGRLRRRVPMLRGETTGVSHDRSHQQRRDTTPSGGGIGSGSNGLDNSQQLSQDASLPMHELQHGNEGDEALPSRDRASSSIVRVYYVFNVAQIDGVTDVNSIPRPEITTEQRDTAASRFIQATGADIRHGGDRAFYRIADDFIMLPEAPAFESYEHYLATALHELVHFSGHPKRLDRQLKNRFGTKEYAAEELVAELGAAFLCAHLGVQGQLRHAEYLANWLQLLKEDNRAIFTAASKASQAADYLRAFSEKLEEAA
jgi:antirestriction protein ArdC